MNNLILKFKGHAQPTSVKVTDWAYNRFKHLESTLLTDTTIIRKIVDVDENRNWDDLPKYEQDDLVDLWSSYFPMGP